VQAKGIAQRAKGVAHREKGIAHRAYGRIRKWECGIRKKRLPNSTFPLLFTNQCFGVTLQQPGMEEKKTKFIGFAHPPEADLRHSIWLVITMAAESTVILSEA
jgi:hypothetical protein